MVSLVDRDRDTEDSLQYNLKMVQKHETLARSFLSLVIHVKEMTSSEFLVLHLIKSAVEEREFALS